MEIVFKLFFALIEHHPILAFLVLAVGLAVLAYWLFCVPVWQDHEGSSS